MRSVLVTRPMPAAADLADMLKREGMQAYISPLMEYAPIEADLLPLLKCHAIIFTSAQAVKIFSDMSLERSLPVFAVGEATAHAALRAGFDKVHTANGDSGNLAGLIRARAAKMILNKIFHPAGEDTAADLNKMLENDKIEVIRVPVYKARFVKSLTRETVEALQSGLITTVTLFSGRTAENFVEILKTSGLDGLSAKLEVVCLSPRVAREASKLKWRAVHVAKSPDIAAMMLLLSDHPSASGSTTSAWLPAYPVIAAFGGIRPMAKRLKISASIIQAWQGRDIVPERYNEAIIAAAEEDAIAIDQLWRERKMPATPPPVHQDAGQPRPHFTRGPDRRQTPAVFDERGYIVSPNYIGPDRRSGLDRRSPDHAKQQQQRIRQEKWRFVSGVSLSFGVITAAILYAGLFILAPEAVEMQNSSDRLKEAEAKLSAANAQLTEWQRLHGPLPSRAAPKKPSLGAIINRGIEKIEGTGGSISDSVADAGTTVSETAQGTGISNGPQELSSLLFLVRQMNATPEGQEKLSGIVEQLQNIAARSPADRTVLASMVDAEKNKNADVKALLGHVDKSNLGAATLLLLLNEMRGNLNNPKGFESDLATLKKYFGDNPQMLKSLDTLAPYAKNGILSRSGLQKEFKGVAGDIVMAKLKGEDASLQDKVLDRMSKYVKMRKIDDIEGQDVDAVVARAQLRLEQNDVQGAMTELRTLDGAPAEAAQPWLQQAEGAMAADQTSLTMIQGILSQVSSPGQTVTDSVTSVFEEAVGTLTGSDSNVIYLSPSMQQSGAGGLGGLLAAPAPASNFGGAVSGSSNGVPDLSQQAPFIP